MNALISTEKQIIDVVQSKKEWNKFNLLSIKIKINNHHIKKILLKLNKPIIMYVREVFLIFVMLSIDIFL